MSRALRRKRASADDGYAYCLLGACEAAAYRLGLAEPNSYAFRTSGVYGRNGLGYGLGRELSLATYAWQTRRMGPDMVNDKNGYEATLELLDEYIAEVKAGRAIEPEGS